VGSKKIGLLMVRAVALFRDRLYAVGHAGPMSRS